jgi:hypothetical protein
MTCARRGLPGALFKTETTSAGLIAPDSSETRGGTISMMSQCMLLRTRPK